MSPGNANFFRPVLFLIIIVPIRAETDGINTISLDSLSATRETARQHFRSSISVNAGLKIFYVILSTQSFTRPPLLYAFMLMGMELPCSSNKNEKRRRKGRFLPVFCKAIPGCVTGSDPAGGTGSVLRCHCSPRPRHASSNSWGPLRYCLTQRVGGSFQRYSHLRG
jgi:hypothetical protein